MSKSEFDQYLALLSGLLRLSLAQREEIASELRDHLEERLGELLAQGVSRQKAIETALEEFGDAAGLAGEFVQIFQRQRRRWMMRMTFGTAVAISAIVLLASAFWPDDRPGPSPRRLVAQDQPQAAASRVPLLSPTLGDADRRAEASLQKRIDVDYLEIPFTDALSHLGAESGLQFFVKVRHLEDSGISTDVPVTVSLKDVSVETALALMLDALELSYVIRDGVLLITTDEDFQSVAEVRVYNCRDLLEAHVGTTELQAPAPNANEVGVAPPPVPTRESKNLEPTESEPAESTPGRGQTSRLAISRDVLAQMGGGGGGFGGAGLGGGGITVQESPLSREWQLMDIIQTAVMPESWEDVSGPGTIGEFDGMIVIRHNPRAHRQVEQVLQMLRDASGQQGWESPASHRRALGGGGFF